MCPIQMALFSFTSATTSDGPVAPTQDRRRTNPPASPKRLIQNSEQKNPPILAQKNLTPKTLVNAAWIFGWHLAMRQIGGQRNQGRGVQIHRFVALPQPSGSNVAHDDMGLSDMFKRKTSEFHG